MSRWTQADVGTAKRRMSDAAQNGISWRKGSKYRNVKTGSYASKREAKRAEELKLLEKAHLHHPSRAAGDGMSKTRVIRYWHRLEWLYKVEEWKQATGEEKWCHFSEVLAPGGDMPSGDTLPKKGEWYWAYVAGALSRERAIQLAEHVSKGEQDAGEDVIAEFG